jgi:acyl carrier protein
VTGPRPDARASLSGVRTIAVAAMHRRTIVEHARRKLARRYDADETPERQAFGLLGGRLLEAASIAITDVFPLRRNLRGDPVRGAAVDAVVRDLARSSPTPLDRRGWLAESREVIAAQERCDVGGAVLFASYHVHKTPWEDDPVRDTPTALDAALGEGQGLWMLVLSMVKPDRPILRAFWEGRRECEARIVDPGDAFADVNVVGLDVDQLLDFARSELAVIDPDARIDQLTLDTPLDELDLESLTLLSLVAALEDCCAVRIARERLAEAMTVRDLLEATLSASALGAGGAASDNRAAAG